MEQIPGDVNHIVEAALDTSIEEWSKPETGAVADTYFVTLENGDRVVCKLGGANVWTGDVVEPEIVRLVRRETTLPVPAVRASGLIRHFDAPNRWAVYDFCSGAVPDVHAEMAYEQVVMEAGAALARLHTAFTFDQIGDFTITTQNDLEVVEPTGRTLLGSQIIEWPVTLRASDELRRPVLAHGDYHPGNLHVDGGSISAILDWGNSHVTHMGYSLARAETRFVDIPPVTNTSRLRRAFRDGYRKHVSIPPSYTEVVNFYRLLWVAQSCVNVLSIASTERGWIQLRRQVRNWLDRQRHRLEGELES